MNEYRRRYYKANRERILAQQKLYKVFYGEAHPEKRLAQGRRHRKKVRAEVVGRLGGCCVRCGGTEGLHVDHIDPSTKSERMRGVGRINNIENLPPRERWAEVEKCQLLCKPCHKVKSARERAA